MIKQPYSFRAGFVTKSKCEHVCSVSRPVADLDDRKKDPRYRPRPLYDIPFMFEAREFLRKKLIGKKVISFALLASRTVYVCGTHDSFGPAPLATRCTATGQEGS